MLSSKNQRVGTVEPETSPLGGLHEPAKGGQAMALLALSHTPIEHQLYRAMLSETAALPARFGAFSARRLMILTGLHGYSTIRRGLAGLVNKLSIERQKTADDNDAQQLGAVYSIFTPEEIFTRRRAVGLAPFPKEVQAYESNRIFGIAIERVVGLHNLSRREAQVALCCAEGLTNAEIGLKLHVSEQTIKFHLRHIFVKFGVRRRAELVSRLLTQGATTGMGEHL
ncbi:MAG TPA: helix-turn-helix transcriptional regulator [Pyrinomonadaceae bacterium]|jgi:DNA-binding CsgD family transcriptional regulator